MVEVSWKPRAFLLENFLTDEETAHLIGKVRLRTGSLVL